jgi:hypothetical protein
MTASIRLGILSRACCFVIHSTMMFSSHNNVNQEHFFRQFVLSWSSVTLFFALITHFGRLVFLSFIASPVASPMARCSMQSSLRRLRWPPDSSTGAICTLTRIYLNQTRVPFLCVLCDSLCLDMRWMHIFRICSVTAFIRSNPHIYLCSLPSDRSYGEGEINWSKGYVYIALLQNFSQLAALYCLVWFYVATGKDLQPFGPGAKFIAVKAVVFMTFWQSVCFHACFQCFFL